MSAPDDFTSQLAAAFDAGFDAPGLSPDGPHRAGLRAVEALVRADERDRLADLLMANALESGDPFAMVIAKELCPRIRREAAVPAKPEMTGWERRQLDAMEDR